MTVSVAGWREWIGRRERRLVGGLLVIQAAVLAGLLATWLPVDAVEYADIGGRMAQAISYATHGVGRGEVYWLGQGVDLRLERLGFWFRAIDGRVYSIFPPWFALAAAPCYRWLGPAGLYLLPALAGLVTTWLTWRLAAAGGGPRFRLAAAALTAFASPLFIYSLEAWEHAPAVALGLVPLVLLRRPAAGLGCGLTAGLAAGGAALLRPEMMLWAGLVALALAAGRRPEARAALAGYLVGYGLVLAGLVAVNQAIYHTPLGLHVQQAPQGIPGVAPSQRWLVMLKHMVVPEEPWSRWYLALALLTGPVAGRCLRPRRLRLAAGLVNLYALVMLLVCFSVVRANSTIFLSLPWVLIALRPGPWPTDRAQGPGAPLLGVRHLGLLAIGFADAVVLLSPTHAGHLWGPRYMLVAIPPAAIVCLWLVTRLTGRRRIIELTIFAALSAYAVSGQIQRLPTMHQMRVGHRELGRRIQACPESRNGVLLDVSHDALLDPYLTNRRAWYYVHSHPELQQIMRRLAAVNRTPVLLLAHWPDVWRHVAGLRVTEVGRYRFSKLWLLRVEPAPPHPPRPGPVGDRLPGAVPQRH